MEKQNTVYSGAMHEAPKAASIQGPQVSARIDNTSAYGDYMQGVKGATKSIANFGDILLKRYKDKRDNENQLELQQIEGERQSEMARRMQLANGAEGGFYDKHGKPDLKAFQKFNDEYIKRALGTNTGYADEADKNARDLYLAQYAEKTRQQAEAALVNSLKQRGEQAFKDSYDLALANDDKPGAIDSALRAYQAGIISEDRFKAYQMKVLKANARRAAGNNGLANAFVDGVWAKYGAGETEEPAQAKPEMAGGEAIDTSGDLKVHVNDQEPPKSIFDGVDAREYRLDFDDTNPETQLAQPVQEQGIFEKADTREYRLDFDSSNLGTQVAQPVPQSAGNGMYTASLYIQNENAPGVILAGLEGMSADEFTLAYTENDIMSNNLQLAADEQGATKLAAQDNTPEPMQVFASQSNKTAGMTLKEYEKAAYATLADLVDRPEYAGLSDDQMKKLLRAAIHVEGAGNIFFSDTENPDQAQLAEEEGIVANILSTRSANIETRLNDIDKSREGLPGVKDQLAAIEKDIAALYSNPEADALRDASDAWYKSKADRSKYAGLIERYKYRYLRETKKTEEEFQKEKINHFRDWMEKNKVYDEMKKDFVNEAKSYLRQCAIDAVVKYRRNGGSSWGEEQKIITNAIEQGKKSLQLGGGWAQWRAEKEANLQARAAIYRREADKQKPKLKAFQDEKQAEADAAKKAEKDAKEAEKQAAKDAEKTPEAMRKKWEESQKNAELKKQWKAEKEEENRKLNPYLYPTRTLAEIRNDPDNIEVVTVPYDQYNAILEQHKAGDGSGVYCTLAGSSKKIAVRPGNVKKVTISTAVFNRLTRGKKLTNGQLQQLVRQFPAEIKYKTF